LALGTFIVVISAQESSIDREDGATVLKALVADLKDGGQVADLRVNDNDDAALFGKEDIDLESAVGSRRRRRRLFGHVHIPHRHHLHVPHRHHMHVPHRHHMHVPHVHLSQSNHIVSRWKGVRSQVDVQNAVWCANVAYAEPEFNRHSKFVGSRYEDKTYKWDIPYTMVAKEDWHTGVGTSQDIQRFIAVDTASKKLMIAFRGSESTADWVANSNIAAAKWNHAGAGPETKVHDGFQRQYDSQRKQLISRVKLYLNGQVAGVPKISNLIVTGHSLGGALATLAAYDLQTTFSSASVDMYTFGAPPVSTLGSDFASRFSQKIQHTASYISRKDPVPCMLPHFSHVRNVLNRRVGGAAELFKTHWFDNTDCGIMGKGWLTPGAGICWVCTAGDHLVTEYCKILNTGCTVFPGLMDQAKHLIDEAGKIVEAGGKKLG
jgi:predicted lipase